MEILRYLTSPRSSSAQGHGNSPLKSADNSDDEIDNNNQLDAFGSEYVEVEESVGLFVPQMRRRRQLLRLDQVQNVLHFDSYRRVMRIQDITFVRAVEEINDSGQLQWWMSIQDDAATVQVWIVHFASLQRLQSWISLLRTVAKRRSIIGDVIRANTSCPTAIKARSSSDTKETVLEITPEE